MPDCQKCTRTTAPPYPPPPPPAPPTEPPPSRIDDGERVFRETFLWRFKDPEDRAAVVRIGEGWDNCMCELGCWGADVEPMIAGLAGALAADVEALGAYALGIAHYCDASRLDRADLPVCHAAPKWAERLAHLAVEIHAAESVARGSA